MPTSGEQPLGGSISAPSPSAPESGSGAIRAFLIADIRGYTTFTQEHGDDAAARLAGKFAQIAEQVIERRGGAEIALRGDEAMTAFPSVRDAIQAAVELQARFVRETIDDPSLPLGVGMGLDAGEAVPIADNYRGGALNLAARLCAIAAPGEILATREVAHLARRMDGVDFIERGSVHLKGFSDPVPVIRLQPTAADPAEEVAFHRVLGYLGAPAAPAIPGAELPNPYKGLRPFEEADAANFFGREALASELVARLRDTRFLAVVGPSGSGKSSVVRAGLLPALRTGALPGSELWKIAEMVPGAHPLEELEAALLRIAEREPASLIEQLERDDHGLLRAVKRVLPSDGTELILVIDQLEEVFTLVDDEDLRAHLLSEISTAVADPRARLRVVATLRADFYDRPLQYRGFADLLKSYVEVVVPLSPDELARAIESPAGRLGVRLEPGLLPLMLTDVAHEPGSLPLLQYALTELFDRREGTVLTIDSYRAIGGISGALAGRADELFAELDGPGREAARQMFLRLVTLGEGTEDTRRRVPQAELDSLEVDPGTVPHVLELFGTSRLLSFDRDALTGEPTVEVAHEALLRAWGRLRGWIEDARDDVRTHRRLALAARDWEEAGGDPSYLLRGGHLEQFESWAATSRVAMTDREREYLERSLEQRTAEQSAEEARRARELKLERRSANRLRTVVAVLAVAALVASGLTIVAVRQRGEAQAQARVARARELASAALVSLDEDPERSILLALEAIRTTRSVDGSVLREAEEALHQAVLATRVVMRLDVDATAVAFSRDGTRFATAGNPSSGELSPVEQENAAKAFVWDAATGERLLTLSSPGRIWDVDFSPDDSRIATATGDGTAAIWNAQTGERLITLRGLYPHWVWADYSPNGKRLAISDQNGVVRVWDALTGALDLRFSGPRQLDGRPVPICGVVFSPDGKRLAGGACSSSVTDAYVWNARTGRTLLTLSGQAADIIDVVFSPNGSEIATASQDGTSRIWDAESGRPLVTLSGGGADNCLEFSPDGTLVAVGDNDGKAHVFDAATGTQVMELAGHSAGLSDIEFSPDGKRVLTGSVDGTVRMWDVTPTGSHEQLTLSTEGPGFWSVQYGPGGGSFLTGAPVQVRDADTGELLQPFRRSPMRSWAAFLPDGRAIAIVSISDSGSPMLMSTSSGRVERVLHEATGQMSALAVSSDGGTIAAALGLGPAGSGVTYLWDASGKPIRMLGKLSPRKENGQVWIFDLAFSPDGSVLASVGVDGLVKLWDPASGTLERSFDAGQTALAAVAFSPDGRLLSTTGFDGTIKLWRASDGRPIRTMTGHSGPVSGLAFSPDGRVLATGGDDATVRLWDVATGRETLSLPGHSESVQDVAFSPDGSRLATASLDGTVKVYVLPIQELIDLARDRLTRGWTEAECRTYLGSATCPPV